MSWVGAGNAVWYADVPNSHCVRVGAGGEVLQTVALDRGCFACMPGGAGRHTRFMVAARWHGPAGMLGQPPSGQILAIEAPGAGWP